MRREPLEPLLPVADEDVKIGLLVHTTWAHDARYQWRIVEINEKRRCVKLRTPRSGQDAPGWTHFTELRHTRRNQRRIQEKQ